jgi:WhiB family redox-sensing transcriptional regulator
MIRQPIGDVESNNVGAELLAFHIPTWMDDGLCAQTSPDDFFPDQGEGVADAKKVCAACPVSTQCLTYALDNRERFGVWGGTTAEERERIRRAAS